MITYEEVKDQTTSDYFRGNIFSIDAFNKKYALYDGETYIQALKRVCDAIASVENTPQLKEYWSARWFDEIYNDWWHPAGSIMQGAGASGKISTQNCVTISLGTVRGNEEWDNLESIIRNTAYTVAKSAAYRQGLGCDFSRLRPANTKVNNSSNVSQGAIHWMKFIDSIGYYVGQRGRIPAFLFSLNISHPDIEEFITVKKDYTKIQNANISVQVTDAFYQAVEGNKDWELKFEIPSLKVGDKVYVDFRSADGDSLMDEDGRFYYICPKDRPYESITKKVSSRKLLELIAKHMCENGEPGIQNIDVARKYSNSDYLYDESAIYDTRIISSNACSEQYLSRDSNCCLSSVNAEKFSVEPDKYEKELETIGTSINRFLDNVNEYEVRYKSYPTDHHKLAIESLRRTGAGYTNIAGWLFKQNLEYGSKEGNLALGHFTERYNYHLYKSSIALGKEKGNFGLFKRSKFEASPFVKRMMSLGLEFSHMRNVTCSSIAPTGSLSLMFRDCVMSYGIEPAFGIYYWKRTRISGKYEYYFCVPHVVREFFKAAGHEIPIESDTIKDTWDGKYGKPIADFIDEHKDRVGIKFKQATEISPLDKLDLMSKVMKSIDSSISVTYLLPEGSNWKDVYNFILEAHKKEVKSIAAFPDRKMYGIVSFMPFKELAFKLTEEGVGIHQQNFSEEERKELQINSVPIENKFEKRPKDVVCDIHTATKKGKHYFALIGLFNNGAPYEVFVGEDSSITKYNGQKGIIRKAKRGQYQLLVDDEVVLENISNELTDEEGALTRMASLSLRHGTPVVYIVQQLTKVEGDLFSFTKVLARILKKYIKDGDKFFGEACPNCGNTLIAIEGCRNCSCGYSKCN